MHVLEETASELSEDESVFDSEAETSDAEDFAGVPVMLTSFNIAKGIVGEGILSLPNGLAAGTGMISGVLIMIAFYTVMMYSFWSLGRACEATDTKSHGACGHAITSGYTFGGIMEATNLVKTAFTCTAYAIVIGKNSEDIWHYVGWESWFATQRGSFLTILVVILMPLCLLRDLSKLAFSSFLGLACEVGVVLFMIWRLFDGAYSETGKYYQEQELETRFSLGEEGQWNYMGVSLQTMVLVGSMSTAFLAHYNAPKFYHQLRRRSPKTFLQAASGGFTSALVLFATCMVVGYLTFGKNCQGNILHNYAHGDTGATIARAAMLIATICGFPIAFTGLRNSALGLFGCGSRRRIWVPVTLGLLSIVGALGWSLNDLGVVNSLGGATLGSLITMIYPGLMIAWTYKASLTNKYVDDRVFSKLEGRFIGRGLAALGVFLGIFGTCIVVTVKIFHKQL